MLPIIFLVVLATIIWAGVDASRRDWTNGKYMTNSTAGWVLGMILLWIVVFPVYIAQRGRAPFKTQP
jgi:drug/metabolite transporter (DMT)-like permease